MPHFLQKIKDFFSLALFQSRKIFLLLKLEISIDLHLCIMAFVRKCGECDWPQVIKQVFLIILCLLHTTLCLHDIKTRVVQIHIVICQKFEI